VTAPTREELGRIVGTVMESAGLNEDASEVCCRIADAVAARMRATPTWWAGEVCEQLAREQMCVICGNSTHKEVEHVEGCPLAEPR
jgi:hypothetical protein